MSIFAKTFSKMLAIRKVTRGIFLVDGHFGRAMSWLGLSDFERGSIGPHHLRRISWKEIQSSLKSNLYLKLKGQAIQVSSGKWLCSKLCSAGMWKLAKHPHQTSLYLLCATWSLWRPEAMIYVCGLSSGLQLVCFHWVPFHWYFLSPWVRFCPSTGNNKRDESLFPQRSHYITKAFIISLIVLCRPWELGDIL